MKRRVFAIAVVAAALVLVAGNWERVWQNLALKRVVQPAGKGKLLFHEWRWGPYRGLKEGSLWQVQDGGVFVIYWGEYSRGQALPGPACTQWVRGEITWQQKSPPDGGPSEYRRSAPWWPHPPLIDMTEFEE